MAFGLRLVSTTGAGEMTGSLLSYAISDSNTNKIYRGDPVKLVSGFLDVASTVATDEVLGAFMGVSYIDTDGGYRWRPRWDGVAGRSKIRAQVAVNDLGRFIAQLDSGQGNATQAMIGTRRNMVANAGSDINGDSGYTIGAAAADGLLFIEKLHELPGAAFGKASQIFEVTVKRRLGV